MYTLYAFLAGLVFGLGLIVSGMYSPVKVLGFLDITGNWDPSLPLVMAGAIAVGAIAFAVARKRTVTLLGAPMRLPQNQPIDVRLAAGSVVFGIGWGLAGFCPGPALVALGTGHVKAFIFVIAMLAGMAIYEFAERRRRQHASAGAQAHAHAHAHPHAHAQPQPHPPAHATGKHRARRGHRC